MRQLRRCDFDQSSKLLFDMTQNKKNGEFWCLVGERKKITKSVLRLRFGCYLSKIRGLQRRTMGLPKSELAADMKSDEVLKAKPSSM